MSHPSDQPKPAAGEWTAETVDELLDYQRRNSQAIADAHNAALAASVHYWQGVATQEWHKGFSASHDEHQKQLAAERCEVCNSELSQCGMQGVDGEPSVDCLVCKLRDQLAAEREKVAWCSVHSPTVDEPITCCPCCESVHEREKVRMLVDALKDSNCMLMSVKGEMYEQAMTQVMDNNTALAKVKEWK